MAVEQDIPLLSYKAQQRGKRGTLPLHMGLLSDGDVFVGVAGWRKTNGNRGFRPALCVYDKLR